MLDHFQIMIWGNLEILEIGNCAYFGADWDRQILKIRPIFLKILNMGSISIKNHEMHIW